MNKDADTFLRFWLGYVFQKILYFIDLSMPVTNRGLRGVLLHLMLGEAIITAIYLHIGNWGHLNILFRYVTTSPL